MYKVGSVVYKKRISEIYFVSSFCSLSLFLSIVKYGHRYQQGPRVATP